MQSRASSATVSNVARTSKPHFSDAVHQLKIERKCVLYSLPDRGCVGTYGMSHKHLLDFELVRAGTEQYSTVLHDVGT